jgi:hypothetical protein
VIADIVSSPTVSVHSLLSTARSPASVAKRLRTVMCPFISRTAAYCSRMASVPVTVLPSRPIKVASGA